MSLLRPAFVLLALLSLLTGIVYPLAVTGIARVAFAREATGSLIVMDGKVAGSELIGQPFSSPAYFWSRPSVTAPMPYNGAASSGSNLGPLQPALKRAVSDRITALRTADPSNASPVPVDLVTASGSGLDPHISPAAAFYQVPRVARARGVAEASLKAIVESYVESRSLGVLGEPRVNVLKLNLELDRLFRAR